MELTGKAKKDFEKWFDANVNMKLFEGELSIDVQCGAYYELIDCFEQLPFPMQYGVLVDFFDSVGIYITDGTYRLKLDKEIFYWVIEIKNVRGREECIDTNQTRLEARTEAIKKANEIYNSTQ